MSEGHSEISVKNLYPIHNIILSVNNQDKEENL